MTPADEAVHPRAVLAITLAGCSLFPAGGRGPRARLSGFGSRRKTVGQADGSVRP